MAQTKGLVVILAEDQYECLEVHYPRLRFIEAGYTVKVVGPRAKEKFLSKEGYWAFTDCVFADIDPKEVKALVIPGGLLCPDRLRRYPDCLNLVAQAKANGAVIGAICHGPWVAISAKILKGVKCTCFVAIKDDVINAGGEYSDQRVVVDKEHRCVTAQIPDDVAEFMKQILILLEGPKL